LDDLRPASFGEAAAPLTIGTHLAFSLFDSLVRDSSELQKRRIGSCMLAARVLWNRLDTN
jgi:hypothetical protein